VLGRPFTLDDLPPEYRSAVFDELPIAADVQDALFARGYVHPTPIQRLAIPLIDRGHDLVGQAETGTGKTIAFGAPIVSAVDPDRRAIQALILTPTRELAQQDADELRILGVPGGVNVALLVGGVEAADQVRTMAAGCQIAVGTPGRVLDLSRQGILQLGWIEYAVLDEADRILDIGFIDEVGKILDMLPHERQTMMFSATIPPGCLEIAKRYMKSPTFVRTVKGHATVKTIDQRFAEVSTTRRLAYLMDLIRAYGERSILVFCNTKKEVRFLDRELWGRGFDVHSLHGDQEQDMRFKIVENFRKDVVQVLVATDVASRGLDIEQVALVVNWDVPREVESYTHRIGRTGRAGRSGTVVTLVTPESRRDFDSIRRQTGFTIEPAPPLTPGRRDGP